MWWHVNIQISIGSKINGYVIITVNTCETRLPFCDMEDLGDKYELTIESPGIPKDKITVKAGTDYIDILGEQEKKTEDKRKNYLYNERSYSHCEDAYSLLKKLFHLQ